MRLLQLVLTLACTAVRCGLAYGPSFIRVPDSLVLYSNNTGVVIDCIARGEPPPTIDWVNENGNPLNLVPSLTRRLHNSSLHFMPFSQDSLGHLRVETRVRCRASNPYGKIVSTLIIVKPGKIPKTTKKSFLIFFPREPPSISREKKCVFTLSIKKRRKNFEEA